MATITPTFLRRTHQEVVVRFAGAATDSGSVNLTTDMIGSLPQETDGATQTVSVVGIGWTGLPTSTVTVARGTNVFTIDSSGGGYLDFNGQELPAEITGNTTGITVTIGGAAAQCWLKLRKTGGYKTQVEDAYYGAYDNPTAAGS